MGAFIRLVAIVTSVIVLLGFGFFAVDEMDKGSKTQQQALDRELSGSNAALDVVPVSPTPDEENAREAQNSSVREVVDDANDVLLAPFANLIDSDSSWVQHGIPALLALLLYGVGLGFLANLLPKERTHAADWRAAES
ncbi:MAG: hypothetical protein ABW135_00635 [Thermoleophilaceae bacterium]